MYRNYGKRAMDFFLAFLGLVVLLPLFFLLAVVIRLDSKGPVFFRQKRVKKDKEYFEILKFRTMRIDTPKNVPTHLLEDPQVYITRTGKFLRKYSLDELPQVINILKGDMSIIGPRPALWNQEDLIAKRDAYGANAVRPGLTGLAQIQGRDALSVEAKAQLDGEYVSKLSFWFDVKVFFGTIASVLKHDGVVEGCTCTQEACKAAEEKELV